MQSSTMVVLRTLVMLAALVAVPVAALFGNSLWARLAKVVAVLQEDLDEEPHSHDEAAGDHAHHAPTATPEYSTPTAQPTTGDGTSPYPTTPQSPYPSTNLAGQSIAAPSDASPSAPVAAVPSPAPHYPHYPHNAPPMTVSAAPLVTSETSPPASNKARLASPAFWPAESATLPSPVAQVQAQSTSNSATAPISANQAAYITPAVPEGMPPPPAYPDETDAAAATAGNVAPTSSDPHQADIERRLQALGALHYRLETAGQQGELFRFQCKMGLEANPNYVGYFEATSSDSLTAMKQVLQQVESWRAGAVRR